MWGLGSGLLGCVNGKSSLTSSVTLVCDDAFLFSLTVHTVQQTRLLLDLASALPSQLLMPRHPDLFLGVAWKLLTFDLFII